MHALVALASWEGLILVGGFFGIVFWKLLTGSISLNQLLEGDIRVPNVPGTFTTYPSAGRAQSLLITTFAAAYYFLLVVQNPRQFPTLPAELVGAVAGSQGLYLAGKAQAILLGPLRDILNRRTP
jgi:hypothetical protein